MYVCYILVRSRNRYCYGNAKIYSLYTVDELHVNCQKHKTVDYCHGNVRKVPFALLSSYKIFRTAVDKINRIYVFI
jgi:hypothetical protein